MKIGVIIPTLNGGSVWQECVHSLGLQSVPIEVLVIDSSSTDQTEMVATAAGFRVISIAQNDFNHGRTRNQGVSELGESVDIIVFMTQDVILSAPDTLRTLATAFSDEQVGAAYGRQVAPETADPLATHARHFNYPAVSSIKGLDDLPDYGIKTVFLSNSFAAYRRTALRAVGGFPNDVIVSEDMFVAARMVQAGYKIAYCADSVVSHAHSYSTLSILKRYFDIGVFHGKEPWIQTLCQGMSEEGFRYLKSEFAFLWHGHKHWLPKFLVDSLAKFAGYQLGKMHHLLPNEINMLLSRHKAYWQRAKGSSDQ